MIHWKLYTSHYQRVRQWRCYKIPTVVLATRNNASCPIFSVSGELFIIIRILLRGNNVSLVLAAAFFFESISSAISWKSSLMTGINENFFSNQINALQYFPLSAISTSNKHLSDKKTATRYSVLTLLHFGNVKWWWNEVMNLISRQC